MSRLWNDPRALVLVSLFTIVPATGLFAINLFRDLPRGLLFAAVCAAIVSAAASFRFFVLSQRKPPLS